MTKVAFIGYGFMGRVHAACWQRIRGVRVAAVCVRDPASLARAVKVYGCVGEALPANLSPDVAVYTDAEKMLAEVRPDIVDVVLPTSLHAVAVERAHSRVCKSGFRSERLYIGSRSDSGYWFVGELGDIKITGRALEPSEFLKKRSSPPGVCIIIR